MSRTQAPKQFDKAAYLKRREEQSKRFRAAVERLSTPKKSSKPTKTGKPAAKAKPKAATKPSKQLTSAPPFGSYRVNETEEGL